MAKKKLRGLSEGKLFQKYAGSGRASDIIMPADDQLVLPSDILTLNWLMGGGIPYGRIVELLGEESGGKSLMAMNFVKQAQAAGGMGIWVDAERSMTQKWAEQNGLDFDDLIILNDNAVETISDFLGEACLLYRSELVNNEPIVVVVDSTAALDSLDAMNTTMEDSKAEMGTRAKAIYKMLRLRNKMWADLGICVIFINQLRDTISTGFQMGVKEDTSPGGKALRYYAAIRLGLYHRRKVQDNHKKRVGSEIFVRTKKNKVAPPRDTVNARVIFDPEYWEDVGFSKYFGFDELVQELGILEKRGNAFYLDGEKIANGKDDLAEVIDEDSDIRSDLIRAADIYTMKSFRKRLEELDHNIYPVE